ncbi:hypothetical protein [Pseudonocardia sp. Ae707_Ps1]|uniref:hypothetical protein n=2 Tax=unclassified Pseudonocardia TaxID=2619320 RepID=UPI0005259C6A|nr:hypothetical protein [Pseudonocardia sp. Ae707_Ps1]
MLQLAAVPQPDEADPEEIERARAAEEKRRQDEVRRKAEEAEYAENRARIEAAGREVDALLERFTAAEGVWHRAAKRYGEAHQAWAFPPPGPKSRSEMRRLRRELEAAEGEYEQAQAAKTRTEEPLVAARARRLHLQMNLPVGHQVSRAERLIAPPSGAKACTCPCECGERTPYVPPKHR